MVEIIPDMIALYRFLSIQGISGREDDTELGYGIHAWLRAAFGDLAPKPWRLLMDRKRPTRILGYAEGDAFMLREHLSISAQPSAAEVCRDPSQTIISKAMPLIGRGRSLGFEVLCCPVVRKAGSGIEKDAFLAAVDAAPGNTLDRGQVYCDWVASKLHEGGARVFDTHLKSFRLVRQVRKTQANGKARQYRPLLRPHVVVAGTLTVQDPEAFHCLLKKGVGRHRAFGYGMLLLRPPS